MTCSSLDLTIDAALADPMIAAAMRADRVDPQTFERLLRSAARDLVGERRPAPFASFTERVRYTFTGCARQW